MFSNKNKKGEAFLKSLSNDLQKEFIGMKGFSLTNLKYIRKFYLFYKKSQQAVDQSDYIFSIPQGASYFIDNKQKKLKKN